jgi:CRP-like cAMP-binding protein
MLHSPGGFRPVEQVHCSVRANLPAQTFAAGQAVRPSLPKQPGVFVIEDGVVALSRRELDGRRHIIEIVQAQDVLFPPQGEEGGVEAEAVTDGRLRFHPTGQSLSAPDFGAWLQDRLRLQHERTLEHVYALGRREARQRLCWFLTRFAEGGALLEVPLTRQDIADYLGLTIETLSREFTKLKRDGAIHYSRNGAIVIRDQMALADPA